MISGTFTSIEALALIDGLVDVIYVIDPETYDLIYVNEAFMAVWGRNVLGRKCHVVLQGREQPCSFCTNDRIFGENLGKSWVWEFQNEKTGHWFRCVDKAIQSAEGRWLRYEVAADITEQKKWEEALRKSEQKLEQEVRARGERVRGLTVYSRCLLEASLDPLVTISPEGLITDVNQATTKATGVPREQLIGKEFAARGKQIPVRSIGHAFREGEKIVKIGGVFQDTSARKAIEDELRRKRDHLEELVSQRTGDLERALKDCKRSNQDLEQFAYVASHDLQEPLRMVASFTQLLEERLQGKLDEKAQKFMGYIIDGARRMHCLINDLLEYSRVGTSGKPFENVDCRRVVDEVLQSLGRNIAETRAEITIRELPVVFGDATQLGQLFQNLLSNALKFHGEVPPKVAVSARKSSQGWVFEVRDNGIGIDARHFDQIFIIFQRLHERGKFPGSGIGLSIAKRIVEHHQGRIWVDSQPGKGTSFFFTIPPKSD